MAKVNLNTIKNWFKTNLKPTQEQFFSTWDSFWHKDDVIPVSSIENFDTYLAEKADKEALTNHIDDTDAHNTLFEEKVDKEDGKGLSTNDYSDDEKQKLALLKVLNGYTDSGVRADGTIKSIVGDFDNSGNGTKVTVDDENKQILLDFETLLINTIADGLSNAVKASIYQKETGGGKSGNEVNTFRDFLRDTVYSASANYFSHVIRLVDTANDNSTGGTKTTEIINRKTGAGNLLYQYVFDIKNELHNGEIGFLNGTVVRNSVLGTDTAKVLTVMRAISASTTIDNPNAEVHFPQVTHPALQLKRGTIKQGGQVMFLDIDVTAANLGSTLTIEGDIAYLEGGGGSDVATLKTYLKGLGYKLRFIKHDGTSESDFNGIINYLGNVSQLEAATEKVLINKEYANKNYVSNIQPVKEISNATYTLVNDDVGKLLLFTNHTGCTITVNAASMDNIGEKIDLFSDVQGDLILSNSGVGMTGSASSNTYNTTKVTIQKVLATKYILSK